MGSLDAATAHMSGLNKMCSLRGGLEALSHSALLQRSVTWSDFAYSTAFCRPLTFPLLPNLCHTFPLLDRFVSSTAFPSPPDRQNPAAWPGGLQIGDREALEFAETLAVVTERINDFDRRAEREGWAYRGEGGKDAVWREKRKEVSDAIYLLEYRLCEMEARNNWGGASPWDMPLRGLTPGTATPPGGLSMAHVLDGSLLELRPIRDPMELQMTDRSVSETVAIDAPLDEIPLDPELPLPRKLQGIHQPFVQVQIQQPPVQLLQHGTDLSPALKWAVHLFLHIAIRGQPPASKRHRTLCERMMGTLWPVLKRFGLLVDSHPFGRDGSHPYDEGVDGAIAADDFETSLAAARHMDMHSCILAWILFVGCCIRDPLTHNYPLFADQQHVHASPAMYSTSASAALGTVAGSGGSGRPQASSHLYYPQLGTTHLEASPQTYRDLFLPLLRRFCERRGLRTKESLESAIARVIWYEKLNWSTRHMYMLWGDLGVGTGYAAEIFDKDL